MEETGKHSHSHKIKSALERKSWADVHMGRIGQKNMAMFSIRLLDESCQRIMACPTPELRSENINFMYLSEGEVLVNVNKMPCLVQACECIVIPSNQPFSIRYFKDCHGYMGSFHADFLGIDLTGASLIKKIQFLQTAESHVVKFDNQKNAFIGILLSRMLYETTLEVPNNEIIRACLNSLIIEITSEYSLNEKLNLKYSDGICNRFMDMVFDINRPKLKVSGYADELNVSVNHLNRVVKKNTGHSVSDWIDESTMLKAKFLLRNTDLSIYDVAIELGMLDPSYFTRRFKMNEGISPTEYRKEVRWK